MTGVIKSGKNGNTALVDESGRLDVFAITQSEAVEKAILGESFFIIHDIVTLTSGSESTIFYARNDDTVSWILSEVTASFGKSAGGAGADFSTKVKLGPSGGTIFQGPDGVAVNLNIGAPNILPITVKYGGEGVTATGGLDFFPALIAKDQSTTPFLSGPIIFPAGASISYSVKPPVGNTSMTAKISVIALRNIER